MSKTGGCKVLDTISYLFRISYGRMTRRLLIFLLYMNHRFFSSKSSDIKRSLYLLSTSFLSVDVPIESSSEYSSAIQKFESSSYDLTLNLLLELDSTIVMLFFLIISISIPTASNAFRLLLF